MYCLNVKKIRLLTVIISLSILIFTACEDSDMLHENTIEGTYSGTIIKLDNSSSKDYLKTMEEAMAEITMSGDNTIQVHLYNVESDTTFMLNYYQLMDSVNVCFTGNAFENMYGHMLGQGHMNGGMMGDLQNNETEWIHHLNDEHEEGDEHFGGFDMQKHTFSYQFNRMENDSIQDLLFQGTKR